MKFFELQEILDEELKDPEFKAIFEEERKILAAERVAMRSRPRPAFTRNKPNKEFSVRVKQAVA